MCYEAIVAIDHQGNLNIIKGHKKYKNIKHHNDWIIADNVYLNKSWFANITFCKNEEQINYIINQLVN